VSTDPTADIARIFRICAFILFFIQKKKINFKMPGQTKTVNKIMNVLKWVVSGLGFVTAFIPGLQPIAALLGATGGAMSLASGISNMIQQKQEGTLTTANKIVNITDIIGGSLGMAGPIASAVSSEAGAIASAAESVSEGIQNAEGVGSQAISTMAKVIPQTKVVSLVSQVAKGAVNVMKGVNYANTIIGGTASVPNTLSQLIRKKDFYDNYMNYVK
jgi:hypothetical protein